MINDQLEEVVSRIFQFRLPIITQLKVRLQFKCVPFSSVRNIALLGCLNCIPFLIHLSNATVAAKQKKQTRGSKCMSLLEQTGAERHGRRFSSWVDFAELFYLSSSDLYQVM